MATRIVRTVADPENPVEPTVLRRRECQDCGRTIFTAEVEIAARDAHRILARLERDRLALRVVG
jgi:hypothetical protein